VPSAAAKQEDPNDSQPLWREAELRAADAMGRLMEFWGFRRHMGRLWTILYLSPEPMTTADLSETLQLSPGERKDFYQAESSVWKLLRRVYERRELNLIREAREAFGDAQQHIDEARRGLGGEDRRRLDYMHQRLSRLNALSKAGERLVGLLVAGRMINPADLQSVEEEE